MTAFFTNEEKLSGIRRIIQDHFSEDSSLADDEAILRAVAADYETKIAGVEPDDSPRVGELIPGIGDEVKAMDGGFTPVVSSNIAAMWYNADGGEVVVRFLNGTAYRYFGVSREIYDRVLWSDSVGSAFNKYIVKGEFPFEKKENWK